MQQNLHRSLSKSIIYTDGDFKDFGEKKGILTDKCLTIVAGKIFSNLFLERFLNGEVIIGQMAFQSVSDDSI